MPRKVERHRGHRKKPVTKKQYERLVQRCRELPQTKLVHPKNYITNLLITVLDLRLETTTVERALEFYRINRSKQIRKLVQLRRLLDSDATDVDIAIQLWGYRYGRRAEMLRRLVKFFDANGIRTQADLEAWVKKADFERDFKGRVPGLAYAAFKWLGVRLGVDTIKPDVHVLNFVASAIGKRLSDTEAVAILEKAARDLGIPAAQLDASIWTYQRGLRSAKSA